MWFWVRLKALIPSSFTRGHITFCVLLCQLINVVHSVQLFYRAKQDGPVLLGRRHPWDH